MLLCLGATSGRGESPYACTAGLIMSDFAYHESNMKNTGIMTGVDLSFSKYAGPILWDTDLVLEAGKVKYTGEAVNLITGDQFHFSANNNSNVLFEAHVVAGLPLDTMIKTGSWSFMPFGGLAYRFLDNEVPWAITSSNEYVSGYDRRSNYLYSPLGFRVDRNLVLGWSATAKAEYDLFWSGNQYSYLSPTVTNRQTSGYGLRGSIAFRYKGRDRDFIIEPFVTYWNIGQSKPLVAPTDQTDSVLVIYEPKNTTTEAGCKFSVSF
jgi:hypothetical protein